MQYTIHIHVSALKNPRLLVLNVKKYKRGGYFPFFHFLLQYTYYNVRTQEKIRILWFYRRGKFSKSISDVREEYPNEIFSKNDLSYKKAFPPEGFRPLNSMFGLSLTCLLS